VVIGSLLLLPSLGITAGGGALLWADLGARDGAGYLSTGSEAFSTATFAIATERIRLPIEGPWANAPAALGTVRIRVTPTDPRVNVFVGIGPTVEVERYLDGVPHAVTSDLGNARLRTVPGSAPPGSPGSQPFWIASSSGTGARTLVWPSEEGTWSAVAMNGDGTRGVSVRASIAATVPALRPIAIGLLAGGGVMLVVGSSLLIGGLTHRRRPA
jgi:hypothetical protein